VVKGPAADATDAPQPWGFLCNPEMKMTMIIIFCPFPNNGAPVEWNWQGKTEVLGEKPVPVPLCPQQIPHGLTRDRTRASAVGGRRLTAWAVARPFIFVRELSLFILIIIRKAVSVEVSVLSVKPGGGTGLWVIELTRNSTWGVTWLMAGTRVFFSVTASNRFWNRRLLWTPPVAYRLQFFLPVIRMPAGQPCMVNDVLSRVFLSPFRIWTALLVFL
jgi:hypothetical protein